MVFIDDPLEGITSPMDYRYIKLLKIPLRILSCWPGLELGEEMLLIEGKCYTYFNFSISIIFLIFGLMYLNDNIHRLSFLEVGHMYITLLMNVLAASRSFLISLSKIYRNRAKKFLTGIHLYQHRNKSEFAMQVHKQIHKVSHYFTIYIIFSMFGTWIIFNATPTFNNYALGKYDMVQQGYLVNGTFELAVYFWMPYNFETSVYGHIYTVLLGWYVSYLCGSAIFVIDLFLSLMIFHLWGHFKILINNLQSLPRPGAGRVMYSEAEMVLIMAKLKQSILYHQFIIGFINEVSETFGLVLLVYLMYYQVGGCLLLVECLQKNAQALIRYVPLTIVMFQQLIQLSIIFETIGTVSGQLRDVVYGVPWECMDCGGRRTALILLMNVQEPVHVKAGGLVNVGVTTMASIIKTSISYCAFLHTANH